MDAIKEAKITAMIMLLMKAGIEVQDAVKMVCGQAAYDKMISDLYDDLRKQS